MRTTHITAKLTTTDAKAKERRYRNILANSGEIMESGEIRDIKNLYVMGYDGELYAIADLNTDPEKQTERYSVKAQADHGKIEGEYLVPSIEKQFGSCKVWLEKDGLHARMYFADGDALADHAYAISEDASYSIGADWYPDGYYGTGYEIDEPIGILREISMVLTGNDPRAKTIDRKGNEAQAQEARDEASDKTTDKGDKMSRKIDELTPDERKALGAEISEVIDKFTVDVPEDETEPTADSAEAEAEPVAEVSEPEAKEEEKEATADSKGAINVLVIKDRKELAHQEIKMTNTTDWLHSEAGHRAFADTLKKAGKMGAAFDAMWRQEAGQHMSLDGVTGLPNPAPVDQYFVDALEKGDGIISHFQFINAKSFRIHLMESEDRAAGHKKGDTKANQTVTDTVRDLFAKMVYKRLDLDATELWENPWLIDFRSRELVDAIIAEIERAAIVSDGRSAGTPDLRMFDGTRGFYSVLADATANNGFATSISAGANTNIYDGVVAARGSIKTEGRQILIAKSSAITTMLQAKANGMYLVAPGARIEDILGVERVYTPSWMDGQTVDAILLVDRAYKHGGEQNIRIRPDFDTSINTNILLDEVPRWGSLGEKKSAVAITLAAGE